MSALDLLYGESVGITDNSLFQFDEELGYFKYVGLTNVPVYLPKGTRSISYMFENLEFQDGACVIADNSCHIDDAKYAFRNTKFNKEFWINSLVDFSYCTDMSGMFVKADLSLIKEFPDYFTTINVVKFNGMFAGAKFGDSFFIGNGFSTCLAKDMSIMFSGATMPKYFYINHLFDVPIGCDAYHAWNFDCSNIVTTEWRRLLAD